MLGLLRFGVVGVVVVAVVDDIVHVRVGVVFLTGPVGLDVLVVRVVSVVLVDGVVDVVPLPVVGYAFRHHFRHMVAGVHAILI